MKAMQTFFALFVFLSCTILPWSTIYCQNNLINKGNSALKENDYAEALSLYEEAELHCHELATVANNIGVISILNNQSEEALNQFSKAIKADNTNAIYYFNRALIHLKNEDYEKGISDLENTIKYGKTNISNENQYAQNLKLKSDRAYVKILKKLAEEEILNHNFEKALEYYDKALIIIPNEKQILFEKAQTALRIPNPFISLEAIENISTNQLNTDQITEVTLTKAFSLGRMNRMKEAIKLLENLTSFKSNEDFRIHELLSFYYLKLKKYNRVLHLLRGKVFENDNTYVIGGNAALYSKNYYTAIDYFKNAKKINPKNINADIGMAMCLKELNSRNQAHAMVDSLSTVHPQNHYVQNAKGIVHKDIGLFYKNKHNQAKANIYFVSSAAAFLAAQNINKNLKNYYQSNQALSLFFSDDKSAARKLWNANPKMGSQNNLALLDASENQYSKAHHRLDSLYKDYFRLYKRSNKLLDYNKDLARKKTKLDNNYQFLTYYFLQEERPQLHSKNLFYLPEIKTDNILSNYILEYSEKTCIEKSDRKKVKKQKRKLKKQKKKKFKKGDCPSF